MPRSPTIWDEQEIRLVEDARAYAKRTAYAATVNPALRQHPWKVYIRNLDWYLVHLDRRSS